MTADQARDRLSRERVLAAAMAVADTEGLAAVTMRRVAADLGVEAMSLYHHVPSKDGLLDGLAEALVVEIAAAAPERNPADPWTTSLRAQCLAAREVVLRHRWGPELIGSRVRVPSVLIVHFESVLATMVEGGLSYHLAHRGLHALGSMVLGYSQELFAIPQGDDDPSAEMAAEMAAMAEAFPHLTAMVASELHDSAEDPLGWCDSQAEFEFTLGLILDGLARQHDTSE
jgi:AcrR family transcriptional regulator